MDSGLCGTCGSVSNFYVGLAQEANEEGRKSLYATSSKQRFESYVKKHKLRESWRDGLGLMSPDAREAHMEKRMWNLYVEWLSYGVGHERALRRASGLAFRGNQMYSYAGRKQAHGTLDPFDGQDMDRTEDLLPNESVSYDNLWKEY